MNFLKKIIFIIPKNFHLSLIAILFGILITVLLELLGIGLILPALTAIIVPEKLLSFKLLAPLHSYITNLELIDLAKKVSVTFVLIIIIKVFLLFLINYLKSKTYFKIINFLTKKLFSKYLYSDYTFHLHKKSSDIIRNVNSEITQFVKKIIDTSLVMITDIFVSVGLISLLIFVRPISTIVAIIIFGTFGIIYFLILKKRLFIWGKQRQFFESQKIKYAQESLLGIKEIKIYNKEKYFEKMFTDKVFSRETIQHKMRIIGPLPRYFVEILSITTFLVVIYFLFETTENFSEIIPEVTLFVASFIRLVPAFTKIINNFQTLRISQPILNNLYNEFCTNIKKNVENNIDKKIEFNKNIILNNISFSYRNSDQNVFENLSLNIKKGELIGIIGKSGEGKSTLLDILSGLIEPKKGEIFIDEVKQKLFNSRWIERIGYVTQRNFIIDDTVEKNITFEEHQKNKTKLEECLKMSRAIEFVNELPNGKDTNLGERGLMVSGGQSQRISIARSLYKNSDIIIFDEATSALDKETSDNILKGILSLKNIKTIIFATHQINMLKDFDRIYEIKNKKLINIK